MTGEQRGCLCVWVVRTCMNRTKAWRSAGPPAAVRRRTARPPAGAPLSFWVISAVVGMRAFT